MQRILARTLYELLSRPWLVAGSLLLILGGVLVSRYAPGFAPWVPTGQLVIAVRAVPFDDVSTEVLDLGIDTMTLSSTEGSRQVSMLTRRASLDPHTDSLTVLLDTTVRAGDYGGFSFELMSPELRNPWQGDTPPEAVTLAHAQVSMPVTYRVDEGGTTVIILSFETLQALYPGEHARTYLPVVQVETRTGGSVGADASGAVRVEGGTILTSATYGMDYDGRMRHNFRAPREAPQTQPIEESVVEAATTTATSTDMDIDEGTSTPSTATSTDEVDATTTEAVDVSRE